MFYITTVTSYISNNGWLHFLD